MPAQICHLLFAEEALNEALGGDAGGLLERQGNLFRFGAQGPDFFYHNQRTLPTGLKYGVAAHREGYGRLTAHLVREIRHLAAQPACTPAALEELTAFTLGWVTHAFLDRATHPFIEYFSGWVDPAKPETAKYFRCHIFYERILDSLMLRQRRGLETAAFPLAAQLDCGERLPYPLVKVLLKALNAAYPRMNFKSRDRRRIENAYGDARFFHTHTDPGETRYRQLAVERDRTDPRRRLALFHPAVLPGDIDFLNAGHADWRHPCRGERTSTASFPELYDQAREAAVPALRLLADALAAGPAGRAGPEAVEAAVGNASLNTGLERSERCALEHCAPLPLPELLDAQYREPAN